MSLITYTVIGLFFGVPFKFWTLVAFVTLEGLVYLVVRTNPYEAGAKLRNKAKRV